MYGKKEKLENNIVKRLFLLRLLRSYMIFSD